MIHLLNYLLESSICVLLFAIAYKVLVSNLTHFSWMRFYLIASVVLSLILPLITIPVQWHAPLTTLDPFSNSFWWNLNQPSTIGTNKSQPDLTPAQSGMNVQWMMLYGLFIAYLIGLTFKAFGLVRNLSIIRQFIRQNPKERENNYWIIRIQNEIPAFSFFNYIFINENYKSLNQADLQRIKNHERIHVKQNHTLDILFVELVSIVFWFNPLMKYLRKSLQEVHEFIVDQKIAGKGEEKKAYAQLLLNLASDAKTFHLATSFTSKHIKRRISMVAKPKTLPVYKLFFMVLVPISALMLLSFSYISNAGKQAPNSKPIKREITSGNKIGEIKWVGNAVFSTDTLNQLLGYKTGDYFSFDDITKRLTEGELSNLYLDNGYVFFKADLATDQKPHRVFNIIITVYEGAKTKIGVVSVKGNTSVPTSEILKNIPIKTGDFFSKKEIIKSIRALAAMNKFDPEKINPNVIPNPENASIDLEFVVTENVKK